MPKSSHILTFAAALCIAPLHALPTFTVGTGGTYASLQAAVDACPSDGCVIQLQDAEHALPREVWIGGKKHLTIEPSPALKAAGTHPRLVRAVATDHGFDDSGTAARPSDPLRPKGWKRWPVSYTSGAGGALDKSNPFSTSGYQYNGLLVLDSCDDIRIEGLRIDGVEPGYFLNTKVWSGKYEVVSGNIGVNLHHSRNVVVRDCEILNFFSGIYINNANPGGGATPSATDVVDVVVNPGKNAGAMGDHIVEHNVLHHNWWAVYDEMDWDVGSVFRFNRSYANYNPKLKELQEAATYEGQNMIGGFMFLTDVPRAIHRIHNNTFWKNAIILGHGYFRVGVQHLYYNNIAGGFDELPGDLRMYGRDARQLLAVGNFWNANDVIAVGASDTNYFYAKSVSGRLADSSLCAQAHLVSPCFLNFDSATPHLQEIKANGLWFNWSRRVAPSARASYQGTTYAFTAVRSLEFFPGGGFFDSTLGIATSKYALKDERWVKTIPWKSTTPGSAGFLEPDWKDSLVMHAIQGQGLRSSGWSSGPMDVGAVVSHSLDATLTGPRSLLGVSKDGTNCWRLPIRMSTRFSGVRVVSLTAWSRTFSMQRTVGGLGDPPQKFATLSIDDSTPANGSSLKVCTGSGPTTGSDLRFEIESEGTTDDGATIRFEPAVFLATVNAPISTGTRSWVRAGRLHLSRVGNDIIAMGLPGGEIRIELRTLDGSLLGAASTTAIDGMASIQLPQGVRRPVLVRVRQGDTSWQQVVLPL